VGDYRRFLELMRVDPAVVPTGLYPIVTLEKQLLNMIGNLVQNWLSCTAK
jgi:hypothetical protein